MACLDRETAAAYLSGYLAVAEAQLWAVHISDCQGCRQTIEEVSGIFDGVRQVLSLADPPSLQSEPPQPELVRGRVHVIHSRAPVLMDSFRGLWKRAPGGRSWAQRSAMAFTVVLVVCAALWWLGARTEVHAKQILRRADLAVGSSRSIPGRVIRKVFQYSITNGSGPIPDGAYRDDYWWDNVEHRFAHVRRDHMGHIRAAQWLLSDGTMYSFDAYDESKPLLVIGPTDSDVRKAIAQLSDGARQQVEALFERSQRPFYRAAAESVQRTEYEVADISGGRNTGSSVHEVVLASGQKLYRVTSHVEVAMPDTLIPHFDVTRLIVDGSFQTLSTQTTGYRRDGRVYQSDQILTEEQVLLPEDVDASVFEPVSLSAAKEVRHVSAQERVQLLERRAGIALAR